MVVHKVTKKETMGVVLCNRAIINSTLSEWNRLPFRFGSANADELPKERAPLHRVKPECRGAHLMIRMAHYLSAASAAS